VAVGRWATTARDVGREPLLILAVLVGAWLRLHQISEQIVADDEWHALHAALQMSCGQIVTHFGVSDHCIPLALYDRLLLLTVGLSELAMRLPVLAAGIGSLIVMPALLRPWLGRSELTAFTWLLAVSPLHIGFSRFARPYDITLLLTFAGVVAAWRWWSCGGPRWALLYLACAALAPWFHLSVLPLSVAPLLVFGAAAAVSRTLTRRRAGLLLAVGGALAAALALLLGPPLLVDLPALTAKTRTPDEPGAHSWAWAAKLWSGTAEPGVLLALGAALLVGALVLARAQPRFVAYLLTVVGLQAAAVVAVRPGLVNYYSILARYLLIVLPAAAVFVAVAVGALEARARRWLAALPQGTLAVFTAAGLFWAGPLGLAYSGPNNWSNHHAYQHWYPALQPRTFQRAAHDADRSGFYARLGVLAPAGSLRVVEAPWRSAWSRNTALALTQHLHRQWVCIGFVGEGQGQTRFSELARGDPRLRFRNFVHVGDSQALKARGVRLVIFHREPDPTDQPSGEAFPDVGPWIERYRRLHGRPLFEDERMAVFDLGG
jgi:hypothetical protein